MSRGAGKIYPIELALAAGTAPTTLYTERLQANPSVLLPEPEYADRFKPEVIAAFERFAHGFHRIFGADRQYPNAKLMPAFMPSESGRPGLTFMAAWGPKTEFPLPRIQKIPDYFSPLVRVAVSFRDTVAAGLDASDRHKDLHRTTLDAHGFIGHLSKSGDGIQADIAYGTNNVQSYNFSVGQAMLLAFEAHAAVGELEDSPLRFHAGVKYIPHNGYIGNEFPPDSQHGLTPQLAPA
jgi:hypothetical protein